MEEAGEGALRRALDELKARLQAEGLFDAARKRALPAWPRRLAVITSPSGAVVRDVSACCARRFPLVEVDLLPVPVQGDTAAAQITRDAATRHRSRGRYDAILLDPRRWLAGRPVGLQRRSAGARDCRQPGAGGQSAIGHETDFSLSDFAADLRAPTPSAAAELLVPDRAALSARLDALHRRLANLQQHALRERSQRADRAFLRLQALRPQARLAALGQRAQQAHARLANAMQRRLERDRASMRHADSVLRASHPRRRIERLRERLAALQGRPQALMARRLQQDALRLRGLARSLHAISPLATVARGYSILLHGDGRIVRGIGDAAVGDILDARLHDGQLKVQVRAKT